MRWGRSPGQLILELHSCWNTLSTKTALLRNWCCLVVLKLTMVESGFVWNKHEMRTIRCLCKNLKWFKMFKNIWNVAKLGFYNLWLASNMSLFCPLWKAHQEVELFLFYTTLLFIEQCKVNVIVTLALSLITFKLSLSAYRKLQCSEASSWNMII